VLFVPVMIANVAVKEASGVCRSLLHPGVYYVHNDSGSKPILYAIDSAGRNLASTIVPASQTTVDAEDCGSAVVNGRPMLVLCDVGDNACRRASYKMIVMEEPRMGASHAVASYQARTQACGAVDVPGRQAS
jgi:hypothetical protein